MRLLIVYLFYYCIKYLIIYYKIILFQLSGYKFICAVIYVNIRDCLVTWYDTFSQRWLEPLETRTYG